MKPAWRCLITASLLAFAAIGLKAQAPAAALSAEIQAENARVSELWEAKKVGEAVKILKRREASPSFAALPALERANIHYNLACGMALLGRPSGEALAYLGMAVGEGFKDFHDLKSDPDLASLRKDPGFTLLFELVRERGDHVRILRNHAAYASEPASELPAFTYQPRNHPDLVKLREACHLDEVAGPGDDSSRLVNLMRWVHAQVRHDGNSVNPEPRTALHLLEVCRTENRGINCRMMATILYEACLALGYPARHITCMPLDEQDPDCHVITAAWAPSLGKWVYLDPTFNGTFRDDKGHLLSIEEVRNGLIQGGPIRPDKGLNWNGQAYDPGKYLDYMAKNLVKLSSPLESAYGYESRPVDTRRYVELDPVTLSPKATGRYGRTTYLHDPSAFWAKP